MSNSLIVGNTTFGLVAESPIGSSELNVESCVIIANGQGIRSDTGATVRISNCHVSGNTSGLVSPGAFVTYGNNRISGDGAGNSVPGAPAPIGPQ